MPKGKPFIPLPILLCRFKFRQDDSTIYSFEAVLDGKKIVGSVKEKEDARDEYDDAISSGGTAMLMENDDKDKDSFKLRIGNLPPQKVRQVKTSSAVTVK